MASSTPLKDLADNFFQCSVCLDQFKEPKQLPCLHRYCSDCLKTVIQASHDGTIKCPMCEQICFIPQGGVDEFKTDFHMKSMLEFIQLQKSFENKELKQCVSCSKKTKVSSYCFKCRDFLCHECYRAHESNKMFTDHQPHTLKLDNIEAHNLTLEKLASLTEDPRCHSHIKEHAKLCCSTCGNEPVCVICTYSKHRGHDIHDVTELAKSERELLKPKVAELNKYKSKIYKLPKTVESVTQTFYNNVAKKTQILKHQHEQQTNKIHYKLAERTAEREGRAADIEKRRHHEKSQISMKHEKQRNRLMIMYDENIKTADRKYDHEYEQLEKKYDEFDGELLRKFQSIDSNLKELTTAIEVLRKQNKDELQEILDNSKHIIKRYENFTATTSSILAAKDEWTDTQCIPDIRAASVPLIEEMEKEFAELDYMSDFIISDITTVIVDEVTLTEYAEYVVDVEGINGNDWWITDITSIKDGNIVITGIVSDDYSHITVINTKGEIQRHDKTETDNIYSHGRFCCSLSEFKVATVCMPDEIGIYDVRNGSYKKKNIRDIISMWQTDWCALCITTDPVNSHIIVGTRSRYVYVFDDQLNYSHIITLPDEISKSRGITVHGDSLLVCDYSGKRAYVVSLEGPESKLMYELMKPDLDEGDCIPSSVCTDKYGFIYILWESNIPGRCSILLQYSQDGRQLMIIKRVDDNSRCVTTLETNEGLKLLIATGESGKLYSFGLTT